MKAIKNKKIAIVGGGPGGLTLARLLQMKGANIKVYERDLNKDVRVQGATLDLHEESGLKALQEAGLMDAFKANFRPGAEKMRIVDKHGTILHDDDNQENDFSRPEIDRGPLRKILLDSLQPGTVVWNSHFTSLTKIGESWLLTFQNGTTAIADIVIAADGSKSKIRPLITPIQAFYAGMTIVEGTVHNSVIATPTMHQLLNGGKIFAMGDEKTIIVSSKGDGSLVFYTGCKTDENWIRNCGVDFTDKAQVLAWFTKEFSGWAPVWLELVENADTNFTPRPQYCMPLDQHWDTASNLTMLGDAAHLMPPYAGEGVNMAMLDALELSVCLTSDEFADTQTALAHFEKEMCARAAEIGKLTLEQTEALHASTALSHMLEMFG